MSYTDERAAVQYALDNDGVVELEGRPYHFSDGLVYNENGAALKGKSPGLTELIFHNATGDMLEVRDGVANALLEGAYVKGASETSHTSGYGLRAVNTHNFQARHFRMNHTKHGVRIDGGNDQFITKLQDFVIGFCEDAITLDNYAQDTFLESGVVANCTGDGVVLNHCSGVYASNMDVLLCQYGVAAKPGAGKEVKAVWLNTVLADNCSSDGFKLSTEGGSLRHVELNNCWASMCGNSEYSNGIKVYPGSGTIEWVRVHGGKYLLNKGSGILLMGGKHVSVSGVQCSDNVQFAPTSRAGIEVWPGACDFSITGCDTGNSDGGNSQGWGVYVHAGASDNYRIEGNNCYNCFSGGVGDTGAGTNKIVTNNMSM